MSGVAQSVLSVELFEFHESIFGLNEVNILTSGYLSSSRWSLYINKITLNKSNNEYLIQVREK